MNKIALITGGSRGLGKDMALSLARKGVDIVLTYHSGMDEANQVVEEIERLGRKAIALPLDMSKFKNLDPFLFSFFETLKAHWNTDRFDYLVNNAGTGATILIDDVTEKDFDYLMNVHFKGVYFLTQKALVHMNDHGAVVFVSSGTTRFSVNGYSVYSSLKSAVETFTKYVAKEYGKRGIRANIVAPGPIETDFNSAAIRNNPQMKNFLAGQTALGRVGNADDIGSVVAFLCSDEAKWVNGIRLEASGGINL